MLLNVEIPEDIFVRHKHFVVFSYFDDNRSNNFDENKRVEDS